MARKAVARPVEPGKDGPETNGQAGISKTDLVCEAVHRSARSVCVLSHMAFMSCA